MGSGVAARRKARREAAAALPPRAQGGGLDRCGRCTRKLCLCEAVGDPAANRTRVTLVLHPREDTKRIGTAPLVLLGLRDARKVVVWPNDGEEHNAPPPGVGLHTALLFPGEGAVPLERLAGKTAPREVVVVDGTWSQARSILDRVPWLASLPRVSLEPAAPSEYGIRRQPRRECLSTVECVVQTLAVLEPELETGHLLRGFRALRDGQIECKERAAEERESGSSLRLTGEDS